MRGILFGAALSGLLSLPALAADPTHVPTLQSLGRLYQAEGRWSDLVRMHLAEADATLGTPEIKRGLFPMMIMAVLSRVVPRRQLLEMMLLGQKMTAAEGQRLGLLNRVLPGDALDADSLASFAGTLDKRISKTSGAGFM